MRRTCLQAVAQLADQDERVVFIGSDIGKRGTEDFASRHPGRFLMEGISEQHLIGMMAGLAMSGKIPYLNTIATFLTRRCFEQIVIDAGLHNLPIRLIGSGGGGVYAPLGPTHIAMDDIAILNTIPHMTIVAVCDADEMARLMPLTLDHPGPMYIRLAKGGDPVISDPGQKFQIGRAIRLRRGARVVLIGTGVATRLLLEAADELAASGVSPTVLHYHTLKPFDAETLAEAAADAEAVVTIEEHGAAGGLGAIVADQLWQLDRRPPRGFCKIAFPDRFLIDHGSQDSLMAKYGVTKERVVAEVVRLLGR